MILFGMIAYVLAQFAVGIWVSRRVKSESDYILAGRSLGPTLVAFSVFATWFGAEAIVATTAEVYDKGISGALVDPVRLRPRGHRRRIPLRGGAMAQGRHHLRRRVPRALLARRREAGGHHPAAGLGVLGGGANTRLRAGAQLQLRPVAPQCHHPGGGAGRLLLGHRRPPGGLRHRLPAGHGRHHRAGRAHRCRRLGGRRRRPGAQTACLRIT